MKPVISVLIAVNAAVVVGLTAACGGTTAGKIPTGADLKGTWNQTGAGYERGAQATWDNQKVVITEATGQGFTGFKEYVKPGIFRGRLVDGKIRGQYAEAGADSTAFNVEFDRQ